MIKKILLICLLSFFVCLVVLYALPPGYGGDRPCSCPYYTGSVEDEWCKQWCGEEGGRCLGEVMKWGCWCRCPSYSWVCDCGYIVICDDFFSKYFSAACDDTYCGWNWY